SRRATTRRGSRVSASAPPRPRRAVCGRRWTRSEPTSASRSCRCERSRGGIHWHPEGLPEGTEPGLSAVAFHAVPNLDPPDPEDRVASSGAHGFVVDICAVEIDRATGVVTVTDYASVHDAGTLLNPLLADGQVR